MSVDYTWGGETIKNIHGDVPRIGGKPFVLHAPYQASEDQLRVTEEIVGGLQAKDACQTLKGVTGSGKTFTMAKIIESVQRPVLVLSHNKTLAAQLYREFKTFFPENAVEYFVSTYDYYQPEAYVPGKDLYIEKDADVNAEIDKLRMSASFSLMERRDIIVVATVSCIFGLANPVSLRDMTHTFRKGAVFSHKEELAQLVRMQYERNDLAPGSGMFRVSGDVIEVYPPYLSTALRISVEWDEIESLKWFDPLTREVSGEEDEVTLYPAKQFVIPKSEVDKGIVRIRSEMEEQYEHFINTGKPLEAERIKTRVEYDLEMLEELGYCSGIENYSRPLAGRLEGERPAVLLDYFPPDFITFIDESHVTIPQIGAMYEGDHNRKMNLVEYGFRLPSALDNRPLKYQEFEDIVGQRVFVSATPGPAEKRLSTRVVEQVIRPTGLLDPEITVRPTEGQMEDLFSEIQKTIKSNCRVLVTTLTKRMAEDLADFFANRGLKVRYLHSEVDTFDRVEILKSLRLGTIDVLVGINLLREGLDLPEVSLVAILDADKIGFLRSTTSLIQTVGRAARNAEGRVIMYADKMSPAMEEAINETKRRRQIQSDYNKAHGITPKTIIKAVEDMIEREQKDKAEGAKTDISIMKSGYNMLSEKDRKAYMKNLETQMLKAAKDLDFETAMVLRDEIEAMKKAGGYGLKK